MPEVGSYYDREKFAKEDTEEEDEGTKESLRDTIALVKNQCAHVYSEPENGERLDDLIRDAQEFYSADEAGWESLLNQTRKKLANVEDPTDVADILQSAMTEAGSLMD